ncbi:MAG TPA: KH domain-containing protein [Candidatus Onthovivens sp.]|nr:KH domain-containing protein [Candidatus Onthovivens sp.]
MNYTSLIHTIIDGFVSNPDTILIREIPQENPRDITLLVVAQNEDTARLIGKKGCVANSIREILAVAGKLENKRVHVKFESFDQKD